MIEIEDFCPGEEAELYEMRREAVHGRCANEYTQEQREAWVPSAFCGNTWRARFLASQTFVARLAGPSGRRVAGFADVQLDGYIDMFYVAHWCPGRGVARALMDEVHERALNKGASRLYSNVSFTAEPFFAICGFTVETVQSLSVKGIELRNLRMSKDLTEAAACASRYCLYP